LCEAYWKLDDQEAAISIYRVLLAKAASLDEEFDPIYVAGLRATRTCPTPLRRRERLIQLVELFRQSSGGGGDVVECGCFRGLSSYVLCSFWQRWNPAFDGCGFHIFDSFEGLSQPTLDDDIPEDWENAEAIRLMTHPGNFAAALDTVKTNLADFPRIDFHPGWIPLTFRALTETRYRFVHVDVDLYDPTLDAFAYFYPRLTPGGLIVSDDYSWPGAKRAIDEFCGEHRVALDLTPFGQAVIRKPSSDTAAT